MVDPEMVADWTVEVLLSPQKHNKATSAAVEVE